MEYIIPIVVGVVCLGLGFLIGFIYRKKKAEKQIGAAETEATRILNEAIKSAEAKKKESILEAREEIYKSRKENENELKERRAEVQKQEHRINQREEALDKKYESVEAKEEKLTQRLKEVDEQEQKLRELEKAEREILERISTMTVEEAKSYLIKQVEEEARHDAAIKLKEIERELKDECDERAREVLSIAIQRCAADHASEITVSTVSLPNDDMKGRIIGREGRNIRAIENLTGVDLIIDDTPEAITLSSFDPVRREVARLTLEKLIADGRIHPARIEETVAKSQKEVDAVIRQEGERAIFETGVAGVHPELIKLLGRMRYRTSYGQNVLKHSIEVSHISGLLASELGSDITLAKRAGLLHDIGKAVTHEVDGSHVNLGVELCEKYHEKADVIHAIHAHHGDIDAESVTDFIVQAADAISAARPGARRENLEAYIKRLEKLEELAHSMKGVDKCFAFQAGREIRILVKPEEVKDDDMVILAHDLARKIESEMNYPGQVKVHVVRETRAVEFAK